MDSASRIGPETERTTSAGLEGERRDADRAIRRASGAALRHGNRLSLLRNGRETYLEWLAEIEGATRWVHVENYIFLNDMVGDLFAETLLRVAGRGVPVRVLVDWWGCADVPEAFWERLRAGGVDVRIVNPPRIARPLAMLRRDHRKFVGVDGRYGSVGGLCIGDKWLETSTTGNLPYRDTAVGVRGPAVADLERAFARIWNRHGEHLPRSERVWLHEMSEEGEEAVRVVSQEPGKMRLLWIMEMLAAGAQRRLWIADAYFLSVPTLHRALIAAARDGVDVRLLTPASNDVPMVASMSRFGYRSLLRAGVRIWEYGGLMMHAKTTVIDGWWSRIGSTNLNITGLLTNWELDVVIEDHAFASRMEAMFEEDLADAFEVHLTDSPGLRHVNTAPTLPRERQDRRSTQRHVRETGARAAAAVAQAGGAVFSGDMLGREERRLMAGVGAAGLGVAAVAARYPRAAAWPLAALAGAAGAAGLARAIQYPVQQEEAEEGGTPSS
jgi:cardiolipin synthase A/B